MGTGRGMGLLKEIYLWICPIFRITNVGLNFVIGWVLLEGRTSMLMHGKDFIHPSISVQPHFLLCDSTQLSQRLSQVLLIQC